MEYDVSDQWTDENSDPRRMRVWDDEQAPPGMRLVRKLDLQLGREGENEEATGPRYWRWYVRPWAADDDGSRSAKYPQKLAQHCECAEEYAKQLAAALKLGAEESEALRVAASWHDRGKDRDVWQRSIGNFEYPQVKLAKSGGRVWRPGIPDTATNLGRCWRWMETPRIWRGTLWRRTMGARVRTSPTMKHSIPTIRKPRQSRRLLMCPRATYGCRRNTGVGVWPT